MDKIEERKKERKKERTKKKTKEKLVRSRKNTSKRKLNEERRLKGCEVRKENNEEEKRRKE